MALLNHLREISNSLVLLVEHLLDQLAVHPLLVLDKKMKKLLLFLILLGCLSVKGQPITIPGGQFPVVQNPPTYLRVILVDTNGLQSANPLYRSNATIEISDLSSLVGTVLLTNNSFLSNLAVNQVFVTNLLQNTNFLSFFTTNFLGVTNIGYIL